MQDFSFSGLSENPKKINTPEAELIPKVNSAKREKSKIAKYHDSYV